MTETLTMANLDDDDAEGLLALVRQLAELNLYGTEMDEDGEDAMTCLNELIEDARELLAKGA